MADKRQVRKTINRIQRVKTWQLFILLILVGLIAATFLRLNNVGMVERRTAVLQADKENNQVALFNNLYALQRYASEHMNASPGKVALEYQYKRDADAAKKKAEKASTSSGSGAYKKAAATCDPEAIANGWRWPDPRYIGCIDSELKKYPAGSVPSIELPNPNLYYHTFYSPAWSPDFAGWAVATSALIGIVIVLRVISLLVLKALLRKHYSSI